MSYKKLPQKSFKISMANGLTLTSVNNDIEKELEKVDEEHQDQELSCALDLDKKLPPNSRRHVSLFNLKSHSKNAFISVHLKHEILVQWQKLQSTSATVESQIEIMVDQRLQQTTVLSMVELYLSHFSHHNCHDYHLTKISKRFREVLT